MKTSESKTTMKTRPILIVAPAREFANVHMVKPTC